MLNNKIVVVTGGAGLLGCEFVTAIAKNKGIAILADIDDESGEAFINSRKERSFYKNIYFHKIDVTSNESINLLIKDISEKFGKIDAWVNNAYPKIKRLNKSLKREYSNCFFEQKYEDFCESISINIGSVFLCSQQIVKYYIQQGFGNIINISSIYGVIAPRFEIYNTTKMTMPVDYAVNKAAIHHLTKYIAKYLKGKKIRVNSISPGGVRNYQPLDFIDAYNSFALNKGMLDINDVSGCLLFLLSDLSEYVNGQNLVVDDGWTL